MKKALLVGLVSSLASIAQAEDPYVGFQLSSVDAELSAGGATADSEPLGAQLSVGKKFNDNFAVEGLLGIGLGSDEVENTGFDFELATVIGMNAVGIIPVSEQFDLYGKLGLAAVEFEDSDGDDSSGEGVMFGIGMTYNFSENYGLNLEYIRYPDAEYDDFDIDVEAGTLNFGVYMYF